MKKPGAQPRKTRREAAARKSTPPKKKRGKRKPAKPSKMPAGWQLIRTSSFRQLQATLIEAQETLDAIRSGAADAVVVSGPAGSQVYSLVGAEQPYRVYVEQMQEGAATVTADGVILYCNRRFAEMTGVPLERAISSRITNYLAGADWEKLLEVRSANSDTAAIKHECTFVAPAGATLPVHVAASNLPTENESLLCLVVTDLTQHKERMQLQVAKELAEKANIEKDNFLAALSHELRTPLTPALIAAASLAGDATLPDLTRQALSMIRRNIELEARLIDDLLDLTRIARGKLELNLAASDLHAALHQAVEICQGEVDAKQQTLNLELNATRTRAAADAVRLQQAFWNLIRNAVKFTPEGGTITVRSENDAEGTFRLEVSDTGIGFDPAITDKIFQAFEQGDRRITRQFGGLGLGLAISKSIIALHGGSLGAHSDGPYRGATFTVELPVSTDVGTTGQATVLTPPGVDGDAQQLRILIVEDHPDTRRGMQRLLETFRHKVKTAASANEALHLASIEPFDLVISDVGLPDQSGLELMRELHSKYHLKGICVSGYGMEEDITNSLKAGFTHHLTKPINLDKLNSVLRELSLQGK